MLLDETKLLTVDSIMNGYDLVSKLYPFIPSMSIWRACEYAAYKRYSLPEPILDVGCGDGQYFRLVWPEINSVVGVDIDVSAIGAARDSGVYSAVYNTPALDMSFSPESFASVFANCSLEHMDNVDIVLNKIWDVLVPNGLFLLSVTTDKFLEWTTLPQLMKVVQDSDVAAHLLDSYKAYHHLVSAFPPNIWANILRKAGFEIVEHVPIVPELLGRSNLFLDTLWHVPIADGSEFGSVLEPYFRGLNNFPDELGRIIRALLAMETNWPVGSGAVFLVRKQGAKR
ncbi:class I SAM-dependent methyltransferase [Geotalea uraniireducens]|uniref:Methyltransferase type 11 n=1 Tax=Geotalea uraniireducens (strain Rf4) TaxID=351605 RepID=A5G843_GEOUR|nr:class I SAM-dependent methyltransferase [Geotalea uraniireducens]ABQ27961.1 Methyltransferase type 11 [Geotalea uraniireducens Rf4]